MRIGLWVAALATAPGAGDAQICIFRWPNAEVAIPAEVARFIAAECSAQRRTAEETEAECLQGETFGYQAQVTILMDGALGEAATGRYRSCQSGLGSDGARFHRRRADCIGGAFGITWRFEFSRRAGLESAEETDFADNTVNYSPIPDPEQAH